MSNYYPKYRNIHRPPHIYLDNTIYFVTTRTFNRICFFNSDDKKRLLLNILQESIKRFNIRLHAWVILDNHYHLLFRLKEGNDLSKFFQNFHINSSRVLNKFDRKPGRKIWHQYQDHGIRDEADFWKHFNYIHHNPIKHEYVKNMEDYNFSSHRFWLEKKGKEWMESCFLLYPIVDFTGVNDV